MRRNYISALIEEVNNLLVVNEQGTKNQIQKLENFLDKEQKRVSEILVLSTILNFITFLSSFNNTNNTNNNEISNDNTSLVITYFDNMNLELKNLLVEKNLKEYSYDVYNAAEDNLLLLFDLIETKIINNKNFTNQAKSKILFCFFTTLRYFKSLSLLLKLLYCIKRNMFCYNNLEEISDILTFVDMDNLIRNSKINADIGLASFTLPISKEAKIKYSCCFDSNYVYVFLTTTGKILKFETNKVKRKTIATLFDECDTFYNINKPYSTILIYEDILYLVLVTGKVVNFKLFSKRGLKFVI